MATDSRRSAGVLLASLLDDLQRLARLETDMARAEIKELLATNGIAAGSLAAAVVLGAVGVLVAIPVWAVMLSPRRRLAAGLWVGIYLGAAAGLAGFGRSRLRLEPPKKTIASLKENGEWIAQRIRSSGI
jgi:hypothetical protein